MASGIESIQKASKPLERKNWAFPWKVFYRALLIQAIFLIVVLATSGLTARYFFRQHFLQQTRIALQDSLIVFSRHMPEHISESWCAESSKDTEFRLTIIDLSGKIVCDSHHEAATMLNHADRPEFIGAQADKFGESQRHSETLNENMFYLAMRVPSRALVVRSAVPLSILSGMMRIYDTSLWGGLVIIALCSAIWAVWTTKAAFFPLARLLLKAQSSSLQEPEMSLEELRDDRGDEWQVLESHIDSIKRDLADKTQSLSREQEESGTIMAAISDAILAVDTQGTPLFFNSRFEVLFETKELRKRNVRLWGLFREPQILEPFRNTLKHGKSDQVRTVVVETEGKRRFLSLSVSPLRNSEGTLYGAVGIFHDITDLKSAEQMRIDFVANAAHELRTPVTSIKGYGQTLELDAAAGAKTDMEFVKALNRNVDRLMNLMNDLLDLSSIESSYVLQRTHVQTETVTSRVIEQLEPAFHSMEQSLTVSYGTGVVFADASRLEQILVNLLNNANKYTPRGGKVDVTWSKTEAGVVVRVSNTGPGIPPEHQERLFERFYRVDRSRSRDQGGTGLGLAIVKHIMQRHGGTAWVESSPGEGASFSCLFLDEPPSDV